MSDQALDGWMAQLGFVLWKDENEFWLVLDDCNNEREATLTERVLWDALMTASATFAESK